MQGNATVAQKAATLAVVVAALGYFVDIYDLILFGMVRTPSLISLGITDKAQLTEQGIYLFNMQMGGMLVGGVLWGIIGDKRGRLSVLFGSITLYSIANIANGLPFIVGHGDVNAYAVCRLVAGIGLAGELGAGITLVSELMTAKNRGTGTTLVASLGVFGGVIAGLIGGAFPGIGVDWRTAYYIGGGMGLALLALRIGVVESGMFHAVAKQANVSRGNFVKLFTNRRRFLRYVAIILVGVPVWYVIGILFIFAKELGGALGLAPEPSPATSLFFCYAGCSVGGVISGVVCQRLASRKQTLGIFLLASAVMSALYFAIGGQSRTVFYVLCALGGTASGYWAVFVATAAELFGTNLRATVTTTVPNFVRGAAVPITLGFKALAPGMGYVGAGIAVGVGSFALAAIGLATLDETYGVDLDFHETDDDPIPKATISGT